MLSHAMVSDKPAATSFPRKIGSPVKLAFWRLLCSSIVFIYLIAFTLITILKETKEKKKKKNIYIYIYILNKTQKTKDEGAGHTTERGSKLSVPLRKIHKY